MPSPGLQKLLEAVRDYVPEDTEEELVGLRRLIDRLELKLSIQAGIYTESDQWDQDGYTSPIQFLRCEAGMAAGAAAERVRVGLHLDDLPLSLAALHRGEIGFAHLALMAGLADHLQGRGREFDERALLARARQETVTRFRRTVEHARHAQDPAGFAEDEARAAESRFLELSPQEDGALWLRGWLEPEGAARLRSVLEPLARPGGQGDDRRRSRRLADALVEALTKDQATELVVTCSLETLAALEGAPAAETEWGGVLSAAAIERLSCGAFFRRLVMDGEGVILDFGRRRRLLSAQGVKAVRARDQTCVWPGCDRPSRWCATHHKKDWQHGGGTSVNGSVPLCGRHHRLRHEGGWQLYRRRDGTWRAIPPLPPAWRSDLPAA